MQKTQKKRKKKKKRSLRVNLISATPPGSYISRKSRGTYRYKENECAEEMKYSGPLNNVLNWFK